MKKALTWVILICMCAMNLCACTGKEKVKTDKIHVALLCYDQSDTYLSAMMDCFKQQFVTDNVNVVFSCYDAAGSQRTQDDQVKELMDEDCDVWCINLVDRTDPSDIIDAAKEIDVPIIFFNREPVAEDMMRWDKIYYVGADAKQSGQLQGELAAQIIQENPQIDRNRDGKIQYVVLEGEPGHQDSIIRTENAVNSLKEEGIELEKLGCGIANWNRAQAQNRMMQLIEQNKTNIELVLANNDDMALGAVDVYTKLNYTEADIPVIFGVDGTDVGLQSVKDGKMTGTVYNDKEGQARVMEQLVIALATGKGMENIPFTKGNYIYMQYYNIDSSNIDQYMDK